MNDNIDTNDDPSIKDDKAPPKAPVPRARQSAAYYYGESPMASMGMGRADYPYGGGYGGGIPYGGEGAGIGTENFLGTLTLTRILRVISQKWPSLIVATLLGLGIGFAYYKTAPVSYRATSVIEMQAKRPRVLKTDEVIINDPNSSGSLNEIINTRLAKLRTREVIMLVAQRVRADFPALKTMTDESLYQMLGWSVELRPRRMSHLIDISARHSQPEIARAIANAYAQTAEVYSMDENRAASDAGVEWLRRTSEAQRKVIEKADEDVLNFRVENQIDVMENQKRAADSVLLQLNSDLARAEVEQTRAADLLEVLSEIRQNPDLISALPEVVPRASEISSSQAALQNAITERDALLMRFTDKHPEVLEAENKVDICRKQFQESVARAYQTANANFDLMTKQTESLRERTKINARLSSELELKMIAAKARLDQLLRDREAADLSYRYLLNRIEEARLSIDDSSANIRVIEEAGLPRRQIYPDPRVAFSTGPLLGLLAGLLFILILDRLEDHITSISDVERHLSTRVLALIPRVHHAERSDLVRFSAEKKFSQFAEAFAGLRGVLESPRFINLAHVVLVVSTQPEEGKTICSSNIAMSYAAAGKKTLLVDLDLRRPRVGRMFNVHENSETEQRRSLMDALLKDDPSVFDSLPVFSGYENLDLVTSRPDPRINPSAVMGAAIVAKFMDWARENYDRVVIDSPPFGMVSDSLTLGALSDSVVMVCRPQRSRYRALRHALRSFVESGAQMLGVIINDVDFKSSGGFGGYEYSQRYGYNRYGRYGRYGYGQNYYRQDIERSDDGISGNRSQYHNEEILEVEDDE